MADTCIVCLGDLEVEPSSPPADGLARDPDSVASAVGVAGGQNGAHDPTIAHLLPCGHDLHNECLKPWVERANSCPICRANFCEVELKAVVGGPTLSSYAVQDKKQEADVDPAVVIEDDTIVEDIEPCQVCEEFGDEAELLLCDGCNSSCHVFCAGLDGIPHGPWFCYDCAGVTHRGRRHSSARLERQVPTSRQRRTIRRGNQNAWARVWQSVFSRINLDLDFPFDVEPDPAEERRTAIERAELQAWQERFRVAQNHGAASRFRDTARAVLEPARRSTPDRERQEVIRAWNAFDKAMEIQRDEAAGIRRKRRASSSTPDEPSTEPERKLKRPRTRRAQEQSEAIEDHAESHAVGSHGQNGESSAQATAPASTRLPTRASAQAIRSRPDISASAGPSFLQCLLKEVETKAPARPTGELAEVGTDGPSADGVASPQHSSRAASPAASNHGTPNTPPLSPTRPASPTPLSSTISPLYPPAPEFSPYSPAESDRRPRALKRDLADRPSKPQHRSPHGSPHGSHRSPHRAHRSPGTSPSRQKDAPSSDEPMSYSTKQEIQRMVGAVLKPFYHKQDINKDQYTDINRDVSRMLYGRVGDASGLANSSERDRWSRLATEEVERAIQALKVGQGKSSEAGESIVQ